MTRQKIRAFSKPSETNDQLKKIITGLIRVHPRGFGFVQPQAGELIQEVFIPKHLTKNAVDGDTVEVLVEGAEFSPKGPEGRVISIIRRGRTHVAGTISEIDHKGTIFVHVPLLGTARTVHLKPAEDYPAKVGDRLIMKVLDWGMADHPVICEKSHYRGHIDDPSCDIPAVIEEFDLRSDFPSAVLQEAKVFGKAVKSGEIKGREDLRRCITCFTIDPDTAKDYDDALSLRLDKGHYHLGVHIADVSHYVQAGTALDDEAKMRCNSTYFPAVCVPMLPEALSNELCSLKPGVNRLALSVFMEFDKNGTLLNSRIARTVIKSAKRFTYKEAKQVLDGENKSPHLPTLRLMVTLCGLLKKKRSERGSVEFLLPEFAVHVDPKGDPTHIEKIEYDITHQLVEEFMLKANETVATYLNEQEKDLAFRVHDEPKEENLREFADLARGLGFRLPKEPTPNDLQDLFVKATDTPFAQQLAIAFIRSMKLAYYSPHNVGHYGLSLDYYCHFTSPIRRYIDLVIHRIVCGEPHDMKQLLKLSQICSDQERISAKAENAVILLKKMRLLKQWVKQGIKEFDAVITRVKSAGLLFDVFGIMVEGFIHISELGNEYFHYDPKMHMLTGERSRTHFRSGQKIRIHLGSLNLITLECNWQILSQSKGKRKGNRR